MSRIKGNDYFAMLKGMAACSCRAAETLEAILQDFQVDRLSDNMKKLHAIENDGDREKHTLVDKLVKEFITPIEREDIMTIAVRVDDITDAIEDILLKIYMYNLQTIRPDAVEFASILSKCCAEVYRIFEEFADFKKSKKLRESIIEMNHLEEKGDALYIRAMRTLHTSPVDARETAAWSEIFGCMETACDTCEHTADMVEHVVMKNT